MASDVDICNLALANLGDAANVTSISPVVGGVQAKHCATFYPIARDALLERHTWNFATKRAPLTVRAETSAQWLYTYTEPADLVRVIAVYDVDAADDTVVPSGEVDAWGAAPGLTPTAQPYVREALASGVRILRTNQADAALRYVAKVTDATKFSPLFVDALAAYLASMLAGPIVKGDAGTTQGLRWRSICFGSDGKSGLLGAAIAADAGQYVSGARPRQPGAWVR